MTGIVETVSRKLQEAEAAARMASPAAGGSPISQSSRVSQASQASRAPWPKFDALPEPTTNVPTTFPLDGLGEIMGRAARSIAEDVQVPDALAGASVLAAASLAAQVHADVVMPHGQRAPLSLFIVTGAGSGDRKSAVDQVVLREVEEVRREQARQYLAEQQSAGDTKEGSKPTARSLTIGKATTEGLQMMLRGQPAVGLFSAEGGELLAGHSMREERRAAGLAWLLKAWGGETLDSLTRGDGLSVLLGRRVAMHVMVQPVLLRGLLGDPLAHGQGLLARCLVAEPASLAGSRLFRDARASDAPAVQHFHARMRHLLQQRPRLHERGDGCELDPRPIPLDAEARALWVEFYNEAERAQAVGCDLEMARAFGSKAAEHAARIAGVVQLMADPDARTVGAAAMDGGMQAAEFYLSEHVRLTGAGRADRHFALLRMLLAWMADRGTVLHRDVLQRSPRPVRDTRADGIGKMLDELVQRGYVRKAGETWEVHPDA